MGSVYAGLLGDADNEVWAVDVSHEHIEAIRARGLRVEGASGDRIVRLNATETPAEVGICNLVIVATKAYDVGNAARSLGPLLDDETLILTIQNGLGAADRICEHLPPDNILIGVASGFGASLQGPGHTHHHGMELIRLGELNGGLTPRLERLAGVWHRAGFNVRTYDDIYQLVWEKFVCNVTFNGPCTVFENPIGKLMANAHAWTIALRCGLEAYEVGRAKGVNFSFDDAEAYVTDFGRRLPGAPTSTLLDHLAKRRSEIDAINGMVPVVAREVGSRAPYNEVITALIKAREAAFVG